MSRAFMERESRTQEYKQDITDIRKTAKTVVAFANGDGGTLIAGVKDRSISVIGLSENRIDELSEKLNTTLYDLISPPIFPQIYEQNIEGKSCLVIRVFPGNQKPYFINSEGIEKGVYLRIGPHTRRASDEMLEELKLQRRRLTYDEEPLLDIGFGELDLSPLPKALLSENSIGSLDLFEYDRLNGEKRPRRGAVLMFHPEPHKWVREAYVIISRMAERTGRKTIESHDIYGPLPLQSEAVLELLCQWLGQNYTLRGTKYEAATSILPLSVLREAIQNAIFHRNYSLPGPIKIALYPDRLEIFSPGHFAGPFVPQELGNGASYIRNKVICQLSRRLQLIEKRGTGIKLIMDTMKQLQFPMPLFEEGAGSFKVTMRWVDSQQSNFNSSEEKDQKIILDLLKKGPTSSSKIAKKLEVSKATALKSIDKLILGGKVVKKGRGPNTQYTAAH
ncbi:MAG: putative DNA binding domain-containing protein [Planctomycetes bacterium]|nr:putative DNA binding domain-containing protein [Planctomycetota bacterium]